MLHVMAVLLFVLLSLNTSVYGNSILHTHALDIFRPTSEPTVYSSESSSPSSQSVTTIQEGTGSSNNIILQSMSFKIGIGLGSVFILVIIIAVVVICCAVWQCRNRKELPISEERHR